MTSPIAVTLVVVVAGLVFAWLGRRRSGLGLIGGAVAWLWLWATPAMTRVVGVPLEREFLLDGRVPAVESFPEADAIVLHGGSMGVDTNLSAYAEMWTSADRVWQAARLWKAGKAPKIIATGNGAKESTLGLLKEMGVKEECVEFVGARNTEEEAKALAGNLISILALISVATSYQSATMTGLIKSGGDTAFAFKTDLLLLALVTLPLSLSALGLGMPTEAVFVILKSEQVIKCPIAAIKVRKFDWIKKAYSE